MQLPKTFIVFLSATLALAVPISAQAQSWTPADGTTATCNSTDSRAITYFQGPYDSNSIAQDACKAMMPTCAYPSPDMICTLSIDFALVGPKATTINATVLVNENKNANYALELEVAPASGNSQPVMWSKYDCEGYLEQFLEKEQPDGCNSDGEGHMGELKVGGGSLQDTVFKASIVNRAR